MHVVIFGSKGEAYFDKYAQSFSMSQSSQLASPTDGSYPAPDLHKHLTEQDHRHSLKSADFERRRVQ
jgi:hypothetical protein